MIGHREIARAIFDTGLRQELVRADEEAFDVGVRPLCHWTHKMLAVFTDGLVVRKNSGIQRPFDGTPSARADAGVCQTLEIAWLRITQRLWRAVNAGPRVSERIGFGSVRRLVTKHRLLAPAPQRLDRN